MLEKSRNAVFFQWFVCQVSRKVGLLKRRVRSHVVSGEIKNCTPLWRKAHLQVKMRKTPQSRTYFWKFRCSTMARGCGAKHICKSKCTKHDVFGPLWYVLMLKTCMRLWRKAHLQVKMYKTRQRRSTFCSSPVEKMPAAVAKSRFGSEDVQNMWGSEHFLKFWCRKISQVES